MFNHRVLRIERLKKGLFQSELAEKMGTSHQQISNWERGIKHPSARNIAKLIKVLNIDGNILFNGGDKCDG